MTDKNGNTMDQTGQNNDVSPEQKKTTRSFLLNPVVMVVEAILLIAVITGITLGSATPKDHYTGSATVISFTESAKHCWVDLRTDTGNTLNDFDMARDTCDHIADGDVIEIVRGKYKPELAPRQ